MKILITLILIAFPFLSHAQSVTQKSNLVNVTVSSAMDSRTLLNSHAPFDYYGHGKVVYSTDEKLINFAEVDKQRRVNSISLYHGGNYFTGYKNFIRITCDANAKESYTMCILNTGHHFTDRKVKCTTLKTNYVSNNSDSRFYFDNAAVCNSVVKTILTQVSEARPAVLTLDRVNKKVTAVEFY